MSSDPPRQTVDLRPSTPLHTFRPQDAWRWCSGAWPKAIDQAFRKSLLPFPPFLRADLGPPETCRTKPNLPNGWALVCQVPSCYLSRSRSLVSKLLLPQIIGQESVQMPPSRAKKQDPCPSLQNAMPGTEQPAAAEK